MAASPAMRINKTVVDRRSMSLHDHNMPALPSQPQTGQPQGFASMSRLVRRVAQATSESPEAGRTPESPATQEAALSQAAGPKGSPVPSVASLGATGSAAAAGPPPETKKGLIGDELVTYEMALRTVYQPLTSKPEEGGMAAAVQGRLGALHGAVKEMIGSRHTKDMVSREQLEKIQERFRRKVAELSHTQVEAESGINVLGSMGSALRNARAVLPPFLRGGSSTTASPARARANAGESSTETAAPAAAAAATPSVAGTPASTASNPPTPAASATPAAGAPTPTAAPAPSATAATPAASGGAVEVAKIEKPEDEALVSSLARYTTGFLQTDAPRIVDKQSLTLFDMQQVARDIVRAEIDRRKGIADASATLELHMAIVTRLLAPDGHIVAATSNAGTGATDDSVSAVSLQALLSRAFKATPEEEAVVATKAKAFAAEGKIVPELELRYKNAELRRYYSLAEYPDKATFDKFCVFEEGEAHKLLAQVQPHHKVDLTHANAFRGMLVVGVLGARNLAAKDKTGKSDPYCIFHVDDDCYRTNTVPQTLDPTWGLEAAFQIDHTSATLEFELWDEDELSGIVGKVLKQRQFTKDDFLGTLSLPVSTLRDDGEMHTAWYPLADKKKATGVTGDIHIRYQYVTAKSSSLMSLNRIQEYTLLLRRLLECEAVDSQSGEGVLSLASILLLDEFALRYGVMPVTRAVVYFSELANHIMDNKAVDIKVLRAVYDSLPQAKAAQTLPLTKGETAKMTNTIDGLAKALWAQLSKYHETFPHNLPDGALEKTIALLDMLRTSEEYVAKYGQNTQNKETEYIEMLQSNALRRYAKLRETIKLESEVLALTDLTGAICDEIENEFAFRDVFPVPSSTAIVSKALVAKVSEDIRACLTKATTVNSDYFLLYARLQELNTEAESAEEDTFTPIPLCTMFDGVLRLWLDATSVLLRDWTTKACAEDKWQSISTELLHSSSVVDVFCSVQQAFQWLLDLYWPDTTQHVGYLTRLSSITVSVVTQYGELIRTGLMKRLEEEHKAAKDDKKKFHIFASDEEKKKEKEDEERRNQPRALAVDLCVRLNCIHTSRLLVGELAETVETAGKEHIWKDNDTQGATVTDLIADGMRALAAVRDSMLNTLVDEMRPTLHQLLATTVQGGKPDGFFARIGKKKDGQDNAKALDQLVEFLNVNLECITANMYYPLFKKCLGALWKALFEELATLAVGEEKELPTRRTAITEAGVALATFFNANGDGLEQSKIDQDKAQLDRVLQLQTAPTADVIALYNEPTALNDVLTRPVLSAILAARKDKDKMAKTFLQGLNAKS